MGLKVRRAVHLIHLSLHASSIWTDVAECLPDQALRELATQYTMASLSASPAITSGKPNDISHSFVHVTNRQLLGRKLFPHKESSLAPIVLQA